MQATGTASTSGLVAAPATGTTGAVRARAGGCPLGGGVERDVESFAERAVRVRAGAVAVDQHDDGPAMVFDIVGLLELVPHRHVGDDDARPLCAQGGPEDQTTEQGEAKGTHGPPP